MPRVIRVDRLADGTLVRIIVCHYCELAVDEEFPHTVGDRSCCKACFDDERSNYQRSYGPEATPESESREVARVTGKPVRRSK